MGTDDSSRGRVPRSPGRPRLYEPHAERDRILAAALEALRRDASREPTVAEILKTAGLSTRAFYRHFGAKEDVILALYGREAEIFAAGVRQAVAEEAHALAALETWIDQVLSLAYDPRRAERMSAMSSPVVHRIVHDTECQANGDDLFAQPLREVLERGLADGTFPDAQPDLDVWTIRAVVMESVRMVRTDRIALTRRAARRHLTSFCMRALGVRNPPYAPIGRHSPNGCLGRGTS